MMLFSKISHTFKISICKYSMFASPNIAAIPASGIREVMSKATELESNGRRIIHLEVGQPNFPTPSLVIDSTINALTTGKTTYVPSDGTKQLRQEICKMYDISKNNSDKGISTDMSQIVVTAGSMLSMFSLFSTVLKPGDECLVPLPGFCNYYQGIKMAHAISVPYVTTPETRYLPTIESIEKLITNKTKCMIICNPGNPTGACFDRELVKDIVELTRSQGIYLISDEIYGDITFDQDHTSVVEFDVVTSKESHIAVVSGVSKSYAMTGYRVGWTRCSPQMAKMLTKIQEPIISCGVPFAQVGAITALQQCRDNMEMMKIEYKNRRNIAVAILTKRGRKPIYIPGGAFYLPIDISTGGLSSYEFAMRLLHEKGCGVAPGIAFDTGHDRSSSIELNRASQLSILDSFIRVSLANSLENVSEGIEKICSLLDELEMKV